MKQGTTTYTVSVLVELPDGTHFYKTWKGGSVKRIHEKARAQYKAEHPGAKVSFGNALGVNNYGAH